MSGSVELAGEEIEGEAIVRAGLSEVFEALTNERELKRWWGSEDAYVITHCRVDLREGGEWLLDATDAAGRSFSIVARILKLVRPTSLVLGWRTSWAPERETIVTFSLEPVGRDTRIRLTHSGFTGGKAGLDTHYWGWRSVFGWASSKIAP
jgi:uncharacterized protein YndB with AHSA1/START domain